MVVILFLYILMFLAIPAGIVGGLVLLVRKKRERLEAGDPLREQRRLGERNRQLALLRSELRCAFCGKPVDPKVDLFQNPIGWYHDRCIEEIGS